MNFKQIAMNYMCITLSLWILSPSLAAEGYSGPKDKLHIYLLIGQSNMAGRAPYTDEEAGVIEKCFLLNGTDTWEKAKNPLNIYSTIRKAPGSQKMNPGYMFAKTMVQADKSVSIGLVVNAKGGTTIGQWKKGKHFYKDAIRRAKEAEKTGTLKGILWHQGESDTGAPEGYLKELETLIGDLRSDLGVKDLPFVAGQITSKTKSTINDQIARLPKTVKNTGVVSSEGLTTMDRWHFDSKSMKLMGERYAEEMIKLLGGAARSSSSLSAVSSVQINKADLAEKSRSYRLWTDNGGRKLNAYLVKIKDGDAYLKASNGNVMPIPLENLSATDHRYIDNQR